MWVLTRQRLAYVKRIVAGFENLLHFIGTAYHVLFELTPLFI